MPLYMSPESINKQKRAREMLIDESISGVTMRDTLPNSSFSLEGEAETMYFKAIRDFFKTSYAHLVMDTDHDICVGESNGTRL